MSEYSYWRAHSKHHKSLPNKEMYDILLQFGYETSYNANNSRDCNYQEQTPTESAIKVDHIAFNLNP